MGQVSAVRMTVLGGRFSAIGLSGAVHAALLLAPFGHGGAAKVTPTDPTVDVMVDSEKAPPPLPEQLAPFENHTAAHPTHTHPYPVPPSHDFTTHDPSIVHPHEEALPKVDTSTILTAEGDLPHFALVIASGTSASGAVASNASAPGAPEAHRDDDALATVPEMAVDTRAQLVHGAIPTYPRAARADGVEATVRLELVVSDTGLVEQARVVRTAGHGLDEAAIEAARQFRFSPAIRQGKPVRVRMSWTVEFRLD